MTTTKQISQADVHLSESNPSRVSDKMRQFLNLIMAPAMWIMSTVPQITDIGRTAKAFSEANDSPLVPFGIAFSIWFPIFVLCLGYAVVQAFSANRTREIYRKTGWWTGAGFTGVTLWAVFSTFLPIDISLWATAFIFVPTVFCLVKAMLIFTYNIQSIDRLERYFTWLPISLIAGWTSLAIFLNWTPLIDTWLQEAVPMSTLSLIIVSLALIFAVWILRKSGANKAYAFPIIWGLGFLVVERFWVDPGYVGVGFTAGLGVLIILTATILKSRRPHEAQD